MKGNLLTALLKSNLTNCEESMGLSGERTALRDEEIMRYVHFSPRRYVRIPVSNDTF